MGQKQMGYEAVLYIGTAGSQAATQVTCATDIDYDVDLETGETTCRGDGSASPIKGERTSVRSAQVTWKMVNDVADTALTTILAAARAGTAIALYYKDRAAGTGFDGDVIVKAKLNSPLRGEQTYDFTAMPNDDLRAPLLNAS